MPICAASAFASSDLRSWNRRGDAGHGQGPVAQHVGRHRGNEGAIDAGREGDDCGIHFGDDPAQFDEFLIH